MIIVVIPIDRGLGFASTHGYEYDARDRAFIVATNTQLLSSLVGFESPPFSHFYDALPVYFEE